MLVLDAIYKLEVYTKKRGAKGEIGIYKIEISPLIFCHLKFVNYLLLRVNTWTVMDLFVFKTSCFQNILEIQRICTLMKANKN